MAMNLACYIIPKSLGSIIPYRPLKPQPLFSWQKSDLQRRSSQKQKKIEPPESGTSCEKRIILKGIILEKEMNHLNQPSIHRFSGEDS